MQPPMEFPCICRGETDPLLLLKAQASRGGTWAEPWVGPREGGDFTSQMQPSPHHLYPSRQETDG